MRYRSPCIAAAISLAANVATLGAQQVGITAIPDSVVTRIDRAFAVLGGAQAPGCAIGISQAGQPVLTRAYGMANLEYSVPNTAETIFESGSVAKQFTAATVVLLAQDGKLSLDDDIRKYLPEVPHFGRKITIRNLLTHTSGLRDQWGLLGLKGLGPGTQVHSLATIIDLVSRQKALNFEPGAEYLYSNTGYALTAIIVQRVTGQPLAKVSDERLFKPLGMTNTQWRDDFTRVVKNRATAYDGNPQRGFHTDMPFTNVYGNGGLLTTVGDMLKWNAFLDNPSVLPGGASLVATMQTPMILNSGKAITYALGVSVSSQDGIREVTHGGSTAGYRTWLARYPDQKLSVAVFCNAGGANTTSLGNVATNLLLARPVRVASVAQTGEPATPTDLERYAGVFREPNTQQVMSIVVRDGKLVSVQPVTVTFVPLGAHRFRVQGLGELTYHVGKVTYATAVSGSDTSRYEMMAPAAPTAKELAAYAGTYWSDELETRVELSVRDTMLVVKQRPASEAALRPTFRDGFTAPEIGSVVFDRDSKGNVIGFGIWAGRVRNVRFTREKQQISRDG
jgi:CubicO group peptidase (beta-lactamase class C family)